MRYSETMLLWSADGACIVVHGPHPDIDFRKLECSGAAAYVTVRTMRGAELAQRMLCDAWSLVINYGCDPGDVHRAFAHVEEYAAIFDTDVEGFQPLGADQAVVVRRGRPLEYVKIGAEA
jgi:hypothetical protein